jgi:hypothetical protein
VTACLTNMCSTIELRRNSDLTAAKVVLKMVVAAGSEPALAAFSTPCLCRLGYATVDVKWHPWPDSHRLGLA